MRNYQATFKEVTTHSWSLRFTTKVEGNSVSSPFDQALKELKEKLDKNDLKSIGAVLDLDDTETIYVEDEPDWDMLPGGKDYD